MKSTVNYIRRHWLQEVSLIGVILIVGLTLTFSTQVGHAYKLATKHLPEPYTELYFKDPANLPTYASSTSSHTIYFVISNRQGHSASYGYTIIEATPDNTAVIASSTFNLADNASTTQKITFRIPQPLSSMRITIKLNGTSQYITQVSKS
jgi:hypothetical protein